MIGLVFILGLCGVAFYFFIFLSICVFGIVLTVTGIKKVKNGKSSVVSKSKKRRVPPVLYIIIGVILIAVSFVILPPIFDCFRGNGYDFLNKSLDLFAKGCIIIGVLFVVCFFAVCVLLLVKGIQTARGLKSVNDDTRGKKSKLSVLLISLGASGIVVLLIALLMFISLFLRKNNSSAYLAYEISSRSSGLVVFGIFVICVFAFTVWAWVKGIRTARKLKSIDDVDTYNKNLKLSVLLFFLGTAGICASIFMVQMFIHGLNNILTIIRLYEDGRLV